MGQGTYTYMEGPPRDTVEFTINGVVYTINETVRPEISLNVFIRDHALLRGTKSMCHEGGCGACIVAAEIHGQTLAVNSCLVPVLICNGWKIQTIEGIGNKKIGYHRIQAALAEMSGSQCGYCSAGMVMNMYSLMQNKEITMKEIENSFGSNICRCTGYRPILDAFKALATDAEPTMARRIQDIEELYKLKTCPKSGEPCKRDCNQLEELTAVEAVHIEFGDSKFHKVLNIEALYNVFMNNPDATYVLNGGNTAHGVYRLEKPQIYIDVNDIGDLHRIEKTSSSLILGGNLTLTMTKNTFMKFSEDPGFHHLKEMANHIDLIASVPVRNIGTLAGNLMIKHEHREFPSDLFLILETAGAELHILESPVQKTSVNFMTFMGMDMRHKLLYSIVLPALSPEHVYRSYKIMPRAQNAHAHVNAGFLFKLDATGTVLERPNIIIGGIKHDFLHAVATEEYLTGKSLLDKKKKKKTPVFKKAIEILDSELNADHVLPDYSPEFRKTLAEGLFYKFVLSLKPENVDEKLRSGATIMERHLSSGKVDYETDKDLWPFNKPIPKTESIYQTSGEAQYVNDLPPQPREVFCAFVHSEYGRCKIESIDATAALEMKGVVAFLTAKDIPGKNVFIDSANKDFLYVFDETLLADTEVACAGQPVGIICADTHQLANEAIKKVKITYTDQMKEKPIITIQEALDSGDKNRLMESMNVPAQRKGTNPIAQVIKGTFECGAQYHYTMEPQSCVCIPTEDGLDVYPASHYVDLLQKSIASCLGMMNNRININVRRLGGSYGAKLSRSNHVSCACAVAAHVLNRPARFIMTIESNMITIGKRVGAKQEYEIGVDADGIVQYMNSNTWHNCGISFNEGAGHETTTFAASCYDNSTWNCVATEVKTDVPSNTFARGPGSTEGIAIAENMMDHIAYALGKDPVEVRLNNMTPDHKEHLSVMIEDIKASSDYDARVEAIKLYNKENRWKKRGIHLTPMKYAFIKFGPWNALVSVYARDGTVSIVHGGIECGQGINTKISQVAAHILGLDIEMISVKPMNNLAAPNNFVTGGSMGTECAAQAVINACKELLARLEPVRTQLTNPTWSELIFSAYSQGVSLCVQSMAQASFADGYPIYGVTVSEVELDVLTGQHLIRRVDLLADAGISMNPEIDRGQAEGAFVMGVGYWTSEDIMYHPETGLLVNNRTWNYKPPGAKDIPMDFRVTLRKKNPNAIGVLGSKATGEPPLCMSYGVLLAIRNALSSARKDVGNDEPWFQFYGPATTEKILMTSLTSKDQMVL